jgi:hypothetical protein
MRVHWLAAAAIVTVACGTTPVPSSNAKPVPSDRIYATEFTKAHHGSAFLVVTRDRGLKGKACTARFYVDGTHVADLRASEQVRLFVEEGAHVVGVSAQGCLGGSDQMSIVATQAKPTLLHIQAGHGEGLKIEPSAF